jgi:hypothetical protein
MVPVEAEDYVLKPPSALLLADIGCGKTDSLLSFIDAGKELFVLVTEPTGVETLIDGIRRRQKRNPQIDYLSRLHYKLIRPAKMSIQTLFDQAHIANSTGADDLQKMQGMALNRAAYPQYIEMLKTIANFRCDRTKQLYGDVTTWGEDRVFAIDSLSGINYAVMKNVSGNRITMTRPEYGICQTVIYDLITTLVGLDCYFVLTCHLEWEKDELTMRTKVMPSTVGVKLAPKVPINFSECIRGRREQDKFLWSTDEPDTTVKWRALPRSNDLPPDFGQLVRAYEARKSYVEEMTRTQT